MRRSIKAVRRRGAIVVAVLLASSAGNTGPSAAQTTSPQRITMPPTERQTTLGPVVGSDLSATSGTYAWKGVPYAKPPVGDLRWKAPADADPWTSPRLTQRFGNACAQASRLYGPGLNNKYDVTIGTSLGKTVGSEDCLYLNIWRPASADVQFPSARR